MDHHWDEAQKQLSGAGRIERERYATAAKTTNVVEDDPEVVRLDRLHETARQRMKNMSPWEIGAVFYDQRDLYTRNGEVDERGYGLGPERHPDEGSYAYVRPAKRVEDLSNAGEDDDDDEDTTPTIQQREAWPWLNYHDMAHDPFFAKLSEPSLWDRIKETLHIGHVEPKTLRSDAHIIEDIDRAMDIHVDLDASDITVTAKEGMITLDGTVIDRRSKELAGEIASGIRGVRGVHNNLTLRDDPSDANVAFVLGLGGLFT